MIWLAACAPPDAPLTPWAIDLGGPATAVHFTEDGALLVVANGELHRVGERGEPPELLQAGVVDAVPVRRTGEVVVHTKAGPIELLQPDGTATELWNSLDVAGLTSSEHGDLVVWNDQYLHVHVVDRALPGVRQLAVDGHVLGMSSDARQVLIADQTFQAWFLVYLDTSHALPVRWPAGEIVDIVLVGRDPRYAEIIPEGDLSWLMVADGDGFVPIQGVMLGDLAAGALTADGSTVVALERVGEEQVLTSYRWGPREPDVLGRGPAGDLDDPPLDGPASASPDGRRLAVGSADGVIVFSGG